MSASTLREKYAYAKAARRIHAEQCATWDYESSNGCAECDQHDAAVRTLGRQLRAATDTAAP